MRIARYYCPESHETCSLLPDCPASRFIGDLAYVEEVVARWRPQKIPKQLQRRWDLDSNPGTGMSPRTPDCISLTGMLHIFM